MEGSSKPYTLAEWEAGIDGLIAPKSVLERLKNTIEALEQEQLRKTIADVLHVSKELGKVDVSLAQQQLELEKEIMRQLQEVKKSVSEICKEVITENKCQGIVPDTVMLCGENGYQYCSEACLNIARAAKSLQIRVAETGNDVE